MWIFLANFPNDMCTWKKQFSLNNLQGFAIQIWEIFISATKRVPLLQGNRTEFTIIYDFDCKVCLALLRVMYLLIAP